MLILVVLFTVLVAPRVIGQADLSPMEGYHYAHRGYHDGNVAVAENSLASFYAAIDAGYGIELDVHLSGDKQLVIIHDETVDRTCNGKGFVKDMTVEQLKDYYDAAFEQALIRSILTSKVMQLIREAADIAAV